MDGGHLVIGGPRRAGSSSAPAPPLCPGKKTGTPNTEHPYSARAVAQGRPDFSGRKASSGPQFPVVLDLILSPPLCKGGPRP